MDICVFLFSKTNGDLCFKGSLLSAFFESLKVDLYQHPDIPYKSSTALIQKLGAGVL